MTTLELMKAHFDDYAKAEKKVYNILYKQPELIRNMTITQLASMANTSTSAVLRFTQTLGYKGYKDFRFALMNDLNQDVNASSNNDVMTSITGLLNQMAMIDPAVFEDAAKAIKEAKMTYITGIHYASLPAQRLQFSLEDAGYRSFVTTDNVHAGHIAPLITEDDCVITFSTRGSSKDHKGFVDAMSGSMPKRSILITHSPHAQIGKYYHHVVVLPSVPGSQYYHILETMMMVFIEQLLPYLYK